MSGKMNLFNIVYHDQVQYQTKVEKVQPNDDPAKFQYHVTGLQEEIGEVLKADKRWKTHRNTTFIPDEKLDEIADCFISVLNINMWSGFTGDELLTAVYNKIIENNARYNKQNS
jgi:NTP pyrophosphatase (non-canonical NTP hydrolase)